MMAGPGFFMMLLMLVMQGNSNDLLDFMDSPSYWNAQKVELTVDALAPSVKGPAAGGENAPKAGDVRRLMAIRSLGELKKKEALPHLKPLVNDKALFVADYANQAIAAIEGTAYNRPAVDRKKLAQDVDLLPVSCGVVAQTALAGGGPISYDKIFEQMKGMMGGMGARAGANDPEEMNRRIDEARRHATDALIEFTGRIGNIRLDAVTAGVAGNLGNDVGFVVVIGRGSYDATAAREAIKADHAFKTETVEGFEVLTQTREMAVVCPSNDRFLLFAGPNREALPVEEVLGAIKEGKRDLPLDADMAQLLGSVDRSKHMWAVMKMTDTYKNADLVAPFDSVTLTVDAKEDEAQYTLVARGKNPDEITASVDKFEKGRQEVLKALKRAPAFPMAMPANIVDFVESINVRNDGMQVTVTAAFKGSSETILQTLPLMMFGMIPMHAQRAVLPPEPEPAPAPE